MKLHAKIIKVMEAVDYLKKDGRIKYGKTKYGYLSEEKITSEVRKAMIANKLTMIPVKMESLPDRDHFEKVLVSYQITDAESGESLTAQAIGKGQDSGDKSMYKAMTGAFKYAQRQTFMISTGDDPDHTASAEVADSIPQPAISGKHLALKSLMAKLKNEGKYTTEKLGAMLGEYGATRISELSDKDTDDLIGLLKGGE
jgi:hypothetical protein